MSGWVLGVSKAGRLHNLMRNLTEAALRPLCSVALLPTKPGAEEKSFATCQRCGVWGRGQLWGCVSSETTGRSIQRRNGPGNPHLHQIWRGGKSSARHRSGW